MLFFIITISINILWYIWSLLGNDRNTQATNNTGVMFSLVRAATDAMQRVIHAANNTRVVFSVGSDLRMYKESL
jgi:hypothetical protein